MRRFRALLMLITALAGCQSAPDSAAPTAVVEANPELLCGDRGHLQGELYGAISARLNWDSDQLECTGMPRPEGRGARLRFAGSANDDLRLAVIVAIPDLQRDATGAEFASNVTLIMEGSGRFFSTADLDNCLTDITALDALDESGDLFAIDGVLYCVSPLAEVNGTSSVSLRELEFSGLLDWSAS